MPTKLSSDKSLLLFLLVLTGLCVPLWVLGSIYDIELIPGFRLYQLPLGMPAIAALILVYREGGRTGMVALLKRTYDFRQIASKIWYIPMLFLYPSIGLLNYWLLGLAGMSLPRLEVSGIILLGYTTVFFMTYGEELGLTGYLLDRLQKRYSALASALILGCIWAAYHIPGFLISGFYSVEWIIAHAVYTIAGRIVFVWVYNNAGKSLFSMALFHSTFGIFWTLLPATGNLQKAPEYYDPRLCALIMLICTSMIIFLFGSKTLTDSRFAKNRAAT